MWREFEPNRIEKFDNKQAVFFNEGIEIIDFENDSVSWSPFTDLTALVVGPAWNIRKGERFSAIHNGKLYFIAEFQEDYFKGNSVDFLDLETGEYGHEFYMNEWTDKTELSDLKLDSDGAYFCVVTVKRGEGYTQCILCPEPDFIWGISKNTGKLEQLESIDDLADDMRIVMEDSNDGNIHFIMGSADASESDYKRYKGFVDIVIEE